MLEETVNMKRADIYVAAEWAPGRKKWNAFCGLELESIGLRRPDGADGEQERRIMRDTADFLRTLWQPHLDLGIEVRLLTGGRACGSAASGMLRVALRVRCSHAKQELAVAQAREIVSGMLPFLAAMEGGYQWMPVDSAPVYEGLFRPFEPKLLAGVFRREGFIRLTVGEVALAERDGQSQCPIEKAVPLDDAPAHGTQYTVFPLVARAEAWDSLCRLLLKQREAVVVSLAVAPTRLAEHEKSFLLRQMAHAERFSRTDEAPAGRNGEAEGRIPALAGRLRDHSGTLLQALSDAAFLVKVQVASPAALPAGLVEAVGCCLTAHAGPANAASSSAPDHFRGGFEALRPAGQEQAEAAARNLEHIRFDLWTGGIAPACIRRLRHLAGVFEAAGCLRFPLPVNRQFPGVRTRFSREAPVESGLPVQGTLVGFGLAEGGRVPLRLTPEDRRRHVYVLGQTGTGKTSLLVAMALQDIASGAGVAVLDPHGDLVDQILPRIPPARRGDVIHVDFGDTEHPIALNLLEHSGVMERDIVINHFMEMFSLLYDMKATGGPVFELYMRTALTIVMAGGKDATLPDVARVFMDPDFVQQRLASVAESYIKDSWKMARAVTGDCSLKEIAPYIVSKLNMFIHNHYIRAIVSQARSDINVRDIMKNRGILLVDLAKGGIGKTFSSFLGMILAGHVLRATLARDTRSPDFHLYVDEFQNVATQSFIEMLSEARKYGLCSVLANQYLNQVPEDIRTAILGNIGTLIGLRMGPEDAEMLERHFAPCFDRADLLNLPVGRACASALVDGRKIQPFSLETLWLGSMGRRAPEMAAAASDARESPPSAAAKAAPEPEDAVPGDTTGRQESPKRTSEAVDQS